MRQLGSWVALGVLSLAAGCAEPAHVEKRWTCMGEEFSAEIYAAIGYNIVDD